MENDLTPRQQEILRLIQNTIEDEGYPPTRAEIARSLGFRSANAAEDHLRALERKGYIELLPGQSRGIRLNLVPDGLPVVGQVAAGEPILADQHIEGYVDLPGNFFSPGADYFLRVRGDSMCKAGILDGDLLAVHRDAEARNGQIIVARLDQEVTVKRYERKRNTVRLLPENDEYEPIVVDLNEQSLVIEGHAVGVIRR